MKYVDDCLSVDKVLFRGGKIVSGKSKARAKKTQDHFRTVERNAISRGMKINNNKTKMLCISAAKTYDPVAFISTSDGTTISSTDSMKVLGFTFDSSPTVKAHLQVTQRKFKCRMWALRHLKRNGFSKQDLVRVYAAMILSLIHI